MGCSSGCGSSAGTICDSGVLGQKSVFDWLSDMASPQGFDAVEVKFKGGRKDFYRNEGNLYLATGDAIVVNSGAGHHIGYVSAQGEVVRLQMKRKKIAYNKELPVIYREASQLDLEKFDQSKNRELPTLFRSRALIQELKLGMKLSDIEYQADNNKATFYYSAEGRVDFRELIKVLAGEFKIRIEMRQISLREEAARLGGIGSCGRELCCSTWMNEFKSVSTSAARYQNLSLNQSKLSGQCGRLKCCLNFELETYMAEIKHLPKVKKIQTKQGIATLQKTNIFKRKMWFSVVDDTNWYELSTKRVKEIIAMNEKGEKPFSLKEDNEAIKISTAELNSDILLMNDRLKENTKKNNPRKKNKKKRHNKHKETKQGGQTLPKEKKEIKPRQDKPVQQKVIPSPSTQTQNSSSKRKFKPRKNVKDND